MISFIIKVSFVVFVVFLILKTFGVMPLATWSWWGITAPLLIGFGFATCVLICQALLLFMIFFIDETRKR
jgi:hypothetical protein